MLQVRTIPRPVVAAVRVVAAEVVAVGLFRLVALTIPASGTEASIVRGVVAVLFGAVGGLVLIVVGLRRWQNADIVAIAPHSAAAMAAITTGDVHYLLWSSVVSPMLAALVAHRTVRQTEMM